MTKKKFESGIALDVYECEPKIDDNLLKIVKEDTECKRNILLLPHVGSATFVTRNKMSELAAKNIIAFFENSEKVPCVVEEMKPKPQK